LTQAIEQEAEKSPEAQRLMTHPGVASLTALAFVLIIGESGRLRQADRQLSRSGPGGRFQRRAAQIGTHQQAGQFLVTFFAGGSGAGHGSQ